MPGSVLYCMRDRVFEHMLCVRSRVLADRGSHDEGWSRARTWACCWWLHPRHVYSGAHPLLYFHGHSVVSAFSLKIADNGYLGVSGAVARQYTLGRADTCPLSFPGSDDRQHGWGVTIRRSIGCPHSLTRTHCGSHPIASADTARLRLRGTDACPYTSCLRLFRPWIAAAARVAARWARRAAHRSVELHGQQQHIVRAVWQFTTGGNVSSAPAIGGDGTVFILSADRALYALNGSTGVAVWSTIITSVLAQPLLWPSLSSPSISNDGSLVFVGGADGFTYAFTSWGGQRRWSYNTGVLYASPLVSSNGVVYVGSSGGSVYALNGTSGALMWAVRYSAFLISSPALSLSGSTVYIGTTGNALLALNASTGAQLWNATTGDYVISSPAVGPDGVVYFGSADGRVRAVGANGTVLWSFLTGWFIDSSPAISADGKWIAIGSSDNYVYSLWTSDGTLRWSFAAADLVYSTPAIDAAGNVFVGSHDTFVYCISGVSGLLLSSFQTGGW